MSHDILAQVLGVNAWKIYDKLKVLHMADV